MKLRYLNESRHIAHLPKGLDHAVNITDEYNPSPFTILEQFQARADEKASDETNAY
jgi:hypothetical protein